MLFLLLLLPLTGCTPFPPMPDSCAIEPDCELNIDEQPKDSQLKMNSTISLTVCACNPWNNSGLKVLSGETYKFEYLNVENWIDGSIESSPDTGWMGGTKKFLGFLVSPFRRSDAENWYSLIGSIGKGDKDVFKAMGNVEMASSGVLYFNANDRLGRYFNNRGKLTLAITRLK